MTFNLHAATRRELLIASGTLFAWAYLPKVARAEGRDPRLLVIVLRGALDGLAAVAPVGDPDWLALRGDKALTLDGKPPALPLDSFFALNPAMPNLHRLYKSGAATIVHATATPYRERSHFDGQDVLESGLAKPGAADTGWLNRALASLQPGDRAGSRDAFAIGPIAPLVVRAIFEIIRAINTDDRVAVLLVEQNARLALDMSTEAYVLEVGRVAVSGSSPELQGNEAVRRSYLGY